MKNEKQDDIEKIASLLTPSTLEQRGGLQRVRTLSAGILKRKNRFSHHLEQLAKRIEIMADQPGINAHNMPIGMLLSAHQHSISIVYLPDRMCWLLFDSNQGPYRMVESRNLEKEVRRAIAAGRDTLPKRFDLDVEIYTTGDFIKTHRKILNQSHWIKNNYKQKKTVLSKNKYAPLRLLAHIFNKLDSWIMKKNKLDSWVTEKNKNGETPIRTAIQYGRTHDISIIFKSLKNIQMTSDRRKKIIRQMAEDILKALDGNYMSENGVTQLMRDFNKYDDYLWEQLLDQSKRYPYHSRIRSAIVTVANEKKASLQSDNSQFKLKQYLYSETNTPLYLLEKKYSQFFHSFWPDQRRKNSDPKENILHAAMRYGDLNFFQEYVTELKLHNPSLCNAWLQEKNKQGDRPMDLLFSDQDNPLLLHIKRYHALPVQFLNDHSFTNEQYTQIYALLNQEIDQTHRRPIDIIIWNMNDLEQLSALMKLKFDIQDYQNFADPGLTLFHSLPHRFPGEKFSEAIKILRYDNWPKEEIIKQLSTKTKQGYTPLADAIKAQNKEALRYFMPYLKDKQDDYWYLKDEQGQTLLHYLASWPDPYSVEECFLNPLAKNDVYMNQKKWFRKQLCARDKDGSSAVLEAAIHNNVKMIQFLLEQEWSLGIRKNMMQWEYLGGYDDQGNHLFHYAMHWPDAQRFKELIDFTYQKDPDVTRMLLNTPNKLGHTPLQSMLHSSEQLENILVLLEHQVSIQHLFHYAATWEAEPLKKLMEHVQQYYPGALPGALSEKNKQGQTPADIAKIHGKPDPLQYYNTIKPFFLMPLLLSYWPTR